MLWSLEDETFQKGETAGRGGAARRKREKPIPVSKNSLEPALALEFPL